MKDRVLDVSTRLLAGMLANPSYNLNNDQLIKKTVTLAIELIKYIDNNVNDEISTTK